MATYVKSDAGQARLEEALRLRFGYAEFRTGQREVIETVLGGRDCLCVMPTGGGKSLCYQLPAVVTAGVTLVVSPLIALMKDQVDQLCGRRVRAAYINSSLEWDEQARRIAGMEGGQYDLVYVAPERFRNRRFTEALARTKLSLLAVDEAHCISEWGHDFRPDYLRLGRVREQLGMPTTIALTATATDQVRRDIAEQLQLREPRVFITGFDRPNLTYEVTCVGGNVEKEELLVEFLKETPGSGIVYAATRKRSEEVAEIVEGRAKRSCVIYHAGLLPERRSGAQEAFMSGRAEVAVATNAFGMGIDKPDVRFVVHYNFPGTVEAYYQEAGRAGRDGLVSRCLLLYAPSDRYVQEFFIESQYPAREVVYQVYEFLRQQKGEPIELSQQEIKDRLGLNVSEMAVGTSLKMLGSAGVLERLQPQQNMAIVRIGSEEGSLVERLSPQAAVQRRVMGALEEIVGGARGEDCYFHPEALARQLDLEREALVRAIGALVEHLPVEYVPPFRGYAIRMIERSRAAESLEIDFEALERRKAAEYEKLDQMIRYARSRGCRRREILEYFGDKSDARCGRCDNCAARGERAGVAAAVEPGPAEEAGGPDQTTEVVRKVLSGIARARGRVGKTTVAAMLVGSSLKKLQRLGLDQLSTFGLLRGFTRDEVGQIINELIACGCVEQEASNRFRPVVKVTPRGWEVMTGEQEADVGLRLPESLLHKVRRGGLVRRVGDEGEAASREAGDDAIRPPPDAGLMRQLRELRDRWAQEARLPLHYILTNETLEELVRKRPTSAEQLLSVKGIGRRKVERYGECLIQLFRGELGAASDDDSESARALSKEAESDDRGPHYWTWRLLERGFSAEECAQIRGLPAGEVLEHAVRAAREGKAVALEAFCSPEQIEAIERVVGKAPPERVRPLMDLLPADVRHEHVQLHVLLRQQKERPGMRDEG